MAKSFIESHQWMEIDGDVAVVGISTYASDELGMVTYVEMPEVGRTLAAGESFGSIESTKSVSELFSPVAGTVIEVHSDLETNPDIVNNDPEGEGWIIKLGNLGETANLMSPEAYQTYVEGLKK